MSGTAAGAYDDESFGALGDEEPARSRDALHGEVEALSPEARAAKRIFDILVAGAVLVTLAPLMVAIALAIRLDSPGPPLFRQTRGGLRGRPFRMFKFRTMYRTEDGVEVEQALPGDRRITRVGAFLRRSSLDELPQLLNVLSGEMSLVGPRPHALKHDRVFAAHVEDYALRQQVAAGLTGWAQVQGARGPTQTVEQIRRRVELDLWYVRNWSLALDISILLRTTAVVIQGHNAI